MRTEWPEIKALSREGYLVEELTPYQYRIECVLDLYPRRRRFHNIANQKRGEYPLYRVEMKLSDLKKFVDEHVAAADKILDDAIAAGQLEELEASRGLKERTTHCGRPGKPKLPGRYHDPNDGPWWTKVSNGPKAG